MAPRAAPRLINQPSHYMPSALSPFFLLTRTCQVLQNEGWRSVLRRARAVALALACRAVGRPPPPPPPYTYADWMRDNEPRASQLKRQRRAASGLAYQPLISFVVPVYNIGPDHLRETLDSVLAQTYPNWELCIADGASTTPGIRPLLDELAAREPRARVRLLERNLGISGNSNAALELARGEFVALLDHDDLIAPNMLSEIVARLNRQPDTDLIYFDEDLLSGDGRERFHPWFKPDWSPHLLLCANYLMHACYRRTLILDAGGFDPRTDGAQDWDLEFRCVERTQRIAHIPKILYHWRQVQGSAALSSAAKPWAFERQFGCIRNHLLRLGIADAQVQGPRTFIFRMTWPLENRPVSVLVMDAAIPPARWTGANQAELTNVEIVCIPGANRNVAALNAAARNARGEVLVFISGQLTPTDNDWLAELVRWARRPEIGVVGAKILNPNGTIQHAGQVLGLAGNCGHVFQHAPDHFYGLYGSVDWYRDLSVVSGLCLATRREVFNALNGFDAALDAPTAAADFCLRARAHDLGVLYNPFAVFMLDAPLAEMAVATTERIRTAIEAGDPYYNPNLGRRVRMPDFRRPGED